MIQNDNIHRYNFNDVNLQSFSTIAKIISFIHILPYKLPFELKWVFELSSYIKNVFGMFQY